MKQNLLSHLLCGQHENIKRKTNTRQEREREIDLKRVEWQEKHNRAAESSQRHLHRPRWCHGENWYRMTTRRSRGETNPSRSALAEEKRMYGKSNGSTRSNKQRTSSSRHLSVTPCQGKHRGRGEETDYTPRPPFSTMAPTDRCNFLCALIVQSADTQPCKCTEDKKPPITNIHTVSIIVVSVISLVFRRHGYNNNNK